MSSIIGLCRFSYPTSSGSGFKSRYLHDLYNENRLHNRLLCFENLLLPGIIGQTDSNFLLVILVSSDLPMWCRDRLFALCAGICQVSIFEAPPNLDHQLVCSTAIKSVREESTSVTIEFRIDDDDAIAVDFISKLRTLQLAAANLGPVVEIDFPRGYHIFIGPEVSLVESVVPHISCAQGWVLKPGNSKTLFNYHHYNFWRKGTCISVSNSLMYLRGVHNSNDSQPNTLTNDKAISWKSASDVLLQRFNVSAHHIEALERLWRSI